MKEAMGEGWDTQGNGSIEKGTDQWRKGWRE